MLGRGLELGSLFFSDESLLEYGQCSLDPLSELGLLELLFISIIPVDS